MSKLFRTEKWLTVDQLIRAWSPELAQGEGDPNQYEQDLRHILLQDIVNGRFDNSGPSREGQRSGLRLITDEGESGFIERRQLLDPIVSDYPWVLTRVALMKEAVLDFAQQHELPFPSWWVDFAGTPTEVPSDAKANIVKPNAAAVVSRPLGKQPRIAEYLGDHFPAGVPGPGSCPRHILKADLLKWDPNLEPLDEATLKKGIDNYNASLTQKKLDPK